MGGSSRARAPCVTVSPMAQLYAQPKGAASPSQRASSASSGSRSDGHRPDALIVSCTRRPLATVPKK